MFDFIAHKVLPIVFGLFGVAAIDTPGNFLRRIMFDVLDRMSGYFQFLGR
jgi:hypothetical protein